MAFRASIITGVIPLHPGDMVGPGGGTASWWTGSNTWQSNQGGPLFASGQSGYAGFEFRNAGTGQIDYGWAHLTVGITSLEIDSWEYNDAGGSIVVVPEPSTSALAGLGGLIAGAAGMRRYRRQRQARQLASATA